MLKNLWYAIEWSNAVSDKPIKAKILGQDLVLYRDVAGKAIAMSDLCVHRGAALSDGWTKGDCIVCPYHAWQYDSNGECVKIPAAGDHGVIPKKARVDAYPTHEKYGWVWVFMGDLPESERPPIPDLGTEFDDPQWRMVTGEWNWNANYERVVENGVDATHVNYVHTFNDPEDALLEGYTIEIDEWTGKGTFDMRPAPTAKLVKRLLGRPVDPNAPRKEVTVSTAWWMPSLVKIHVKLAIGELIIYDTNIPVDDDHTRTLWIGFRNFFTQKVFDGDAKRRILKTFSEDAAIVEGVRPELLPVDFAGELHHKTDALSVAYRKRRHELMDQGWGIDTHRIAAMGNKVKTVIPSPARRENPELAHAWVMKEVPVIGDMGADHGEVEFLADEPAN